METNKVLENNVLTVYVKGQIDSATASQFESAVLGDKNEVDIVVDFNDVTYVSSAGLRVILMIHKHLTEINKKFVLKGVNDEILDVLTMTGFTSFLTIEKKQ